MRVLILGTVGPKMTEVAQMWVKKQSWEFKTHVLSSFDLTRTKWSEAFPTFEILKASECKTNEFNQKWMGLHPDDSWIFDHVKNSACCEQPWFSNVIKTCPNLIVSSESPNDMLNTDDLNPLDEIFLTEIRKPLRIGLYRQLFFPHLTLEELQAKLQDITKPEYAYKVLSYRVATKEFVWRDLMTTSVVPSTNAVTITNVSSTVVPVTVVPVTVVPVTKVQGTQTAVAPIAPTQFETKEQTVISSVQKQQQQYSFKPQDTIIYLDLVVLDTTMMQSVYQYALKAIQSIPCQPVVDTTQCGVSPVHSRIQIPIMVKNECDTLLVVTNGFYLIQTMIATQMIKHGGISL